MAKGEALCKDRPADAVACFDETVALLRPLLGQRARHLENERTIDAVPCRIVKLRLHRAAIASPTQHDGVPTIAVMRRDEFLIALATAAVVVGVGVEQGIVLAMVLSVLDHLRRHYNPHDRVVVLDENDRPIGATGSPR